MKIGIIICDRYHTCAGGKCIRALKNREGAFSRYQGKDVELVGYTTCGGCPGGNIEYVPAEMKNNGAEVVHLATGLIVGYPPCPHIRILLRLPANEVRLGGGRWNTSDSPEILSDTYAIGHLERAALAGLAPSNLDR